MRSSPKSEEFEYNNYLKSTSPVIIAVLFKTKDDRKYLFLQTLPKISHRIRRCFYIY